MTVGTDLAIARQVRRAMTNLGADRDQLVPISWRGDRLYPLFEQLGAPADLLAIVYGYGDTMRNEEVLDALRRWNARHTARPPARSLVL
jgi:hypothetical protein